MSFSIKEIKEHLDKTPIDHLSNVMSKYRDDTRKGVIKLIQQGEKKIKALEDEKCRIEEMKQYETKYAEYAYICGVDEAGRGPLAGPVVAGAVILNPNHDILYLNDSKKLSPSKREKLYDEIMEKALYVGVGISSAKRIDEINILQATYEAMRQAIHNLDQKPDILLNDAVIIPDIDNKIKQVKIIHGDAISISIAAASIIAKVTRDRLMKELDQVYPEYSFAQNKGYGSEQHIKTLKEYGACPIHRQSFIKNI